MGMIKDSTIEKMIRKQVKYWEDSKRVEEEKKETPKPFITISREYGCNASSIGLAIAEKLNAIENTDQWTCYNKELIDKIVQDHDISEKLIETIDTKKREEMSELLRTMLTDYPPQVTVYKKLATTIRGLSIHGRAIFVGRAGVVITRGLKYGTHVRFTAPLSYRVHKVMELNGIKNKLEAEKIVEQKDSERHHFMTQYVKFEANNPASYDVTINVSRFSEQEIAGIIIGTIKARKFITA